MNVIIFGAAGGIGKWAVKHALLSGYHVTAYVRNAQKITEANKNLTVIQGGIYDEQEMTKALSGQDAVVWCVGIPLKKSYHKLFLELGVGNNTPVIIKYPFLKMTLQNPKAIYTCVNLSEAYCPREIQRRAICINGDIGEVLTELL